MDTDHSVGEDAKPIAHENNENHENKERSVVWTSEDASYFLTSAIHEAQQPLANALRSRPITTSSFIFVLLLIFAGAAGAGWILFTQLEKTERIADAARSGLNDALSKQHQLQARSDTLQAQLEAAQTEQERVSRQYRDENESLRAQMREKRDNEEELRKSQTDLQRFRRQNELLKSQISGLEMEKQALARQLNAVRAMADDGFEIPGQSPEQTTDSIASDDDASTAEPHVEPRSETPTEVPVSGDESENPPTLYETSRINDGGVAPEPAPEPVQEEELAGDTDTEQPEAREQAEQEENA